MLNQAEKSKALAVSAQVVEVAGDASRIAQAAEAWLQSLSVEECRALDSLKKDYERYLEKQTPAWMGYDAKSRMPICRYNADYYGHQNSGAKSAPSFFSAAASALREDAVGVIYRRQQILWAEKRYKLDVSHQIFAELIDFATDELPRLVADEVGIKILANRIAYLECVLSYADLEAGFTSQPEHSRKSILLKMLQTLRLNKARAEKEAATRCAREKLNDLVTQTESIQQRVLLSITHLKQPSEYLLPAVYFDLIEQGNIPESMTKWPMDKIIVALIRHELYAPLQLEDLQDAASGWKTYLQPLVAQHLKDVAHQTEFLKLLNALYEELSGFKELVETLRLARSLAGICGDDWCYGQKEGQRLMQALLEIVTASHERLQTHVSALRTCIQSLDEAATAAAKGVKTSTVEGLSFRDLQGDLSATETLLQGRRALLGEIEQNMKSWPIDAAKRTQQQIEQLKVQVNALRARYQLTPLESAQITKSVGPVSPVSSSTARVAPAVAPPANSVTATSTTTPKVSNKVKILKPISSFPQVLEIAAPVRKPLNITDITLATGGHLIVPECLSKQIEYEPSFFRGKNLRYQFFLNQQNLFATLAQGLNFMDTLRSHLNDPFTALNALQNLKPEFIQSMFAVLDAELARIQAARNTLSFYHDTSKSFLSTWEVLIHERKRLLQDELNFYLTILDVQMRDVADFSKSSQDELMCEKAFIAQTWLSTRDMVTAAMLPDQNIFYRLNKFREYMTSADVSQFVSASSSESKSKVGQGSSTHSDVLQQLQAGQISSIGLDAAKEAAIDIRVAKVHETDKEVKAMLAEAKKLRAEAKTAAAPKGDLSTNASQHPQESQLKP